MIDKFIQIFKGLEERFGYHIADYSEGDEKKSGTSKTSSYPHSRDMWESHLLGKKFTVKTNYGNKIADSLGICPINKESKCKWGAIDLDNYKPNVEELFKKLNSINVKLAPFKSKSGGIHIYIFMTEEVPAMLVREKLHSIKNIFAVEKPDKIFPVQKYLNLDKGSAGSWINLPYYKALNTERYMIKKDGSKASIQEFFKWFDENQTTLDKLKKLKSNLDEGEVGDWFKDGPPCMQALAKFGVEKSKRNDTLQDMTRYIKLRYPDNEEWKNKVGEYNKKFFEPLGEGLPYAEVTNVISSRDKKDYAYRCNEDWLKPHCNKELCIARKFGIGGSGNTDLVLGPLSYVKSTPKIWYLGFNGEEVSLGSKEIVKQDLARESATEQTGKTPPKVKNWDLQIRGLQSKATPIDAPEESRPMVRLKNYLETHCFNLRRTTDKKQILFGKPYHENDPNTKEVVRVKFMFDYFYKFLKTNSWETTENTTHQMIKKLAGISREKFHITDDTKKWVYVLEVKEFHSEEVKQDDMDFGQESEVPY
tara:strand:- start:1746 stop:3347 length:1602 start_codon:yes stop_codon:yes gene_type:complete